MVDLFLVLLPCHRMPNIECAREPQLLIDVASIIFRFFIVQPHIQLCVSLILVIAIRPNRLLATANHGQFIRYCIVYSR